MQTSLSKLYTAPAVIRGLQTLCFIRFELGREDCAGSVGSSSSSSFLCSVKSSQLRLHIYVVEGGVYGLGHYYAEYFFRKSLSIGLGLRPRPFFRLVFEMNLATKLVRYCLVGIYGHYKPAGTRSTLVSLGILQHAGLWAYNSHRYLLNSI